LTDATTDPRETTFLFQRLSVAVQRFNAVCLADTFPVSESAPRTFQTSSFFQGHSDGGISVYIPPKSVYLKFFMWLFWMILKL